jgi:hypothetical protein
MFDFGVAHSSCCECVTPFRPAVVVVGVVVVEGCCPKRQEQEHRHPLLLARVFNKAQAMGPQTAFDFDRTCQCPPGRSEHRGGRMASRLPACLPACLPAACLYAKASPNSPLLTYLLTPRSLTAHKAQRLRATNPPKQTGVSMPYLKSNWASMPPLEEFGRFAFGEIFTIPEMTLTQTDPTARACYLHGMCAPLRSIDRSAWLIDLLIGLAGWLAACNYPPSSRLTHPSESTHRPTCK